VCKSLLAFPVARVAPVLACWWGVLLVAQMVGQSACKAPSKMVSAYPGSSTP
jgi:hypothetical protein